MVASQSSAESSSAGAMRAVAAQFTKMSTGPASSARRAASAQPCGVARSARTVRHSRPCARTARAVSSSPSSVRATATTSAPASA